MFELNIEFISNTLLNVHLFENNENVLVAYKLAFSFNISWPWCL